MSTKAHAKTQGKTPAAPAAARIPQPPVAEQEHEAERPDIAAQLEGAARLGHSLGAVGVDHSPPPTIQRQESPEEEEEELQLKRESAALQRQELPEDEEEELQQKPELAVLQRQELPEEEEEELQTKPATGVQRKGGSEGHRLDDETAGRINCARGGGQLLEGVLQVQMSASLGHDFSGVRVHTDAEADDLNRQLQATAFTTGPDIFFRRGEYKPGSAGGRELIAHELSHVVQQSSGRVPAGGDGSGIIVRPAGDAFEQEADRVAATATRAISTAGHRQPPVEDGLRIQGELDNFQPRAGGGQPVTASEGLETRINSARGSGQTLSSDVREPMEKVFGAYFGGVRVHGDSAAAALYPPRQAKAFSTAPANFFKRGTKEGTGGGDGAHWETAIQREVVDANDQPIKTPDVVAYYTIQGRPPDQGVLATAASMIRDPAKRYTVLNVKNLVAMIERKTVVPHVPIAVRAAEEQEEQKEEEAGEAPEWQRQLRTALAGLPYMDQQALWSAFRARVGEKLPIALVHTTRATAEIRRFKLFVATSMYLNSCAEVIADAFAHVVGPHATDLPFVVEALGFLQDNIIQAKLPSLPRQTGVFIASQDYRWEVGQRLSGGDAGPLRRGYQLLQERFTIPREVLALRDYVDQLSYNMEAKSHARWILTLSGEAEA